MIGKHIAVIVLLSLVSSALGACASSQNSSTPMELAEGSLSVPPTSTTISNSEVVLHSVEVTNDLAFAIDTLGENPIDRKLDMYTPAKAGDTPVLVFLPGSWQSRGVYSKKAKAIAERGVNVLVIDYPMSGPEYLIRNRGKGHRKISEIVACAIRFARASASDSDDETTLVALSGFSLGGGAVAHTALAGEHANQIWEEFAASSGGPPGQVECTVSEGSTHVDALVGIAGAYDRYVGYDGEYGREFIQQHDLALWDLLYGTVGINPELKVRLLHSEVDSVIPYDNSINFYDLLTEAGYNVELIPYEGGHKVPIDLTIETILDVFEESSIN